MVRRKRRATSEPAVDTELITDVRALAQPLRSPADLDPLIDRVGDARYVLLGEASHGTHEFYTWRAEISRRLIQEKGFSLIAVEGDWPDCYRVNRYIKGQGDAGADAREVLHAFDRWPTWMWANEEMVELAEWLREYNESLSSQLQVGFYGLDVYSLWDSLYQVLSYVAKRDPDSLPVARQAFRCFEPYGENAQKYARATAWANKDCEDEVVDMLAKFRRDSHVSAVDGGEARFNADQNALVVKNAERYYRTMVQGGTASWNVRDRHMMETLERLMRHRGAESKVIVWEHNTHIGDARFTDMADDGMVNVGQLVREQHDAHDVVLVGFATHRGTVIAGDEWEAPMERMRVPAARPGSWEDVLHQACGGDSLLIMDQWPDSQGRPDSQERGHRAIGVVYHPQHEHLGNYVPTVLSRRYDAMLYLEQSEALRPLHVARLKPEQDLPETYPSGL